MKANDAVLFSKGVGSEGDPSSFHVAEVVCIPIHVTLKTRDIEKEELTWIIHNTTSNFVHLCYFLKWK